jgi:hypothetical protein
MMTNDDSAITIITEYEAGTITREEAKRRLVELGYLPDRAEDVIATAQRHG